MFNQTIIAGIEVVFSVEDYQVDFEVGGEYTHQTSSNITITRWLLKQFEVAKKEFGYLIAIPYTEDGEEQRRISWYKKLGFRNQEGSRVWEWGVKRIIDYVDFEVGYCPAISVTGEQQEEVYDYEVICYVSLPCRGERVDYHYWKGKARRIDSNYQGQLIHEEYTNGDISVLISYKYTDCIYNYMTDDFICTEKIVPLGYHYFN